MAQRNFVKFTFFKVRPEWRQRSADERAQDKREFAAALEDFARDHFLRTYSLVGTRGDADLMVRAVASSLDPIHELHVLINQSGLMRWADTPYSYLAMTKESVYSDEPQPLEPRPGSDSRYLFVYPMWKKREWYPLAPDERMRIMKGHIETGAALRRDRDQHRLLLWPGRSGVRGVFQRRRPGRVPGSRAGAAGYGVEHVHALGDPHLHVHLVVRGEGSRRAVNEEIKDITIIGAGPVGLVTAFWAGMREASSQIVESLPELGGQLTTLYPEKWIFDVPGFPRIIAKDFVEELRKQSLEQFDVPVSLETTADRVEYDDIDGERVLRLVTDKGDFLSRTIIIAGGHGAFEPKKLPGYDMTPWEGKGAYYLVGEKSEFEGKDVVIIGGGDSACDWVLNLLDTASSITLVHRREGFRAHEVTVKEIMEAAEAGKVDLKTPYQVQEVSGNGNGWIEKLRIFHSEDEEVVHELACDAVLLQLGFKTALGPLKEWPLEVEKGSIKVDPLMKTSMEAVWAAGDITVFDGKLKLIATGFAEAAIAVAQAVHHIRPEMKIQPKYSTNTGVPGSVEGQP